MTTFKIGEKYSEKPELGDMIALKNQTQEVVKCQETGVKMINIDANTLVKGDLPFLKKLGLTISNPDTEKPVALGADFVADTWGERINKWFADDEYDPEAEEEKKDDDSDSFLFGATTGALLGGHSSWTPSLSGGGFSGGLSNGGGFGGFGGGSFSGGGASRGF